jgi:nitrate reductase gamma subunit
VKLFQAIAAVALILLAGIIAASVPWLRTPAAVAVSYVSVGVFVAGICYRFVLWAKSSVPFCIPVTCGQQASSPGLRHDRLDNPNTSSGAALRVAMEVLCFRSLWREHRPETRNGVLVYANDRRLWLVSIAFHYALLVVMLRHLALLFAPVPHMLTGLGRIDDFSLFGARLSFSGLLLLVSLGALFFRRLWNARVRFISLFTDHFALLLLFAVGVSGELLHSSGQKDLEAIKHFAHSLSAFHPAMHAVIPPLFLVHRLLVGALLIYFPFSKLMHIGGIVANPVYNLANNSRARMHANPWNYPVASRSIPTGEPPIEAGSKCPNR